MDALTSESIERLEKLNRSVLEKLDGLSEYELRRPMTPTGTNLLRVVKHLASVQAEYFGDVFGRPWPEPMPWLSDDADINDDMFATADESSEWVLDFYRRSWVHARETFDVTGPDDTGTVPWWPPDHRHPTLHAVVVHMTIETARHAGHLDIVRELIDGRAGRMPDDPGLPDGSEIDWPAYVGKVADAAERFAGEESDTSTSR